jgi:hypothetical protein
MGVIWMSPALRIGAAMLCCNPMAASSPLDIGDGPGSFDHTE